MEHSGIGKQGKPSDDEPGAVVIRRASVEDSEFITCCTIELAIETEDDILDVGRTREFTKSCFEYPDSISFWIASVDGKDVACAQLSTEYDFFEDSSYCKLQSVFVLKEFRGKQIFSRLNDHCI